jgi:hypothetical protein
VRLRSSPTDAAAPFVVASLAACQLVGSSFEEDFTLHLDKGGHVMSLDYSPPQVRKRGDVGMAPSPC